MISEEEYLTLTLSYLLDVECHHTLDDIIFTPYLLAYLLGRRGLPALVSTDVWIS